MIQVLGRNKKQKDNEFVLYRVHFESFNMNHSTTGVLPLYIRYLWTL